MSHLSNHFAVAPDAYNAFVVLETDVQPLGLRMKIVNRTTGGRPSTPVTSSEDIEWLRS